MYCNLFLKIVVSSKAKCIYITTLLLLKSSSLELVASNKTYDADCFQGKKILLFCTFLQAL